MTLDKKYSRAYFDQNSTISQRSLTQSLDNKTFCYNVSIFVHPTIKVIYQEPLKLKLKYELVDKVEDQDENFCKTCVVLDSGSSNEFLLEVPFDSRCVGKNCTTKLAVKGKFNSENPFVLGSSKSIEIVLEISNSGEAAYFTKLKVSVSTSQFLKIPPFCYDIKNLHQYLECDINGVSMLKDEKLIIPLHIDSEKLDGKSITIFANVTSEGEEFSPEDNSCVVELSLKNFSKVEVIG